MSVPFFDDFGKDAKDLLDEDYSFKQVIKAKIDTGVGVGVTLENERSTKGGKVSLLGKVAAKYKHNSGFAIDKLQHKADGNLVAETSLTGVAPGLKFTFKGDTGYKGDLGVEYKSGILAFKSEIDVIELSGFKASAMLGYEGFQAGAMASYKLPGEKPADFQEYSGALGYSYMGGKYFVGLQSKKKFSEHNLSFMYKPVDLVTVSGRLTACPSSNSQLLTLGSLYKPNPSTSFKMKVSSNGIVGSSVTHKLGKKVSITGCAELDIAELGTPKMGATINLS